MKFHNDPFLWKTINDVVPMASLETRERIYNELEGNMWKISKIEALAKIYEK